MAEVLLTAVLGKLIEELLSLTPSLSGLGRRGYDIQEWCQSLTDINTVLKDHEGVMFRRAELISWHQDLKNLAEDIHDAVTDLKDLKQQRGILRWIRKVVRRDSTLEEELRAITARMRLIYRRKKLLETAKESNKERTRPMAGPVSAESKLLGRQREFEKIFDFLEMPSDGESGFDVISIAGMGGIGKTTLAQCVYNDDKVASFNVKSWCCVTMDFKLSDIYRSIIEQLTGQCHIQDSSAMQDKLRTELRGKKFFIVLDDYWNPDMLEFDALRAPFMTAKPGSKLIITTRDRDIAKRFSKEERIIDLGYMSKEDCWSLFCSRSNLEMSSTSNLVTIGKEICERCEGVPLAVSVMSGMLSGIHEEAGWQRVLSDLVSGNVRNVHSILRMSYDYLSDPLKACFSLCHIFPKGHIFDRESTVDIWVSAGIIICDEQSEEDKAGDRYFDELVSRALLTRNPNGLYVMHDMVRGMGEKVNGDTHGRWDKKVGSWETIRHLIVSEEITDNVFNTLKSVPQGMVQLRTLIIDGKNCIIENDMDDLFLKLRHLRLLQMQNFKVTKISKYIGKMKHLRKLEIRCFYELKKWPAIKKLINLVELDIGCCYSLKEPLPSELGSLVQLKKLSLSYCEMIGKIPSQLGRLVELQKLLIRSCKGLSGPIPRELGNLLKLREFTIDNCPGLIGPIPLEMSSLIKLRKFSISYCDGLAGPIPRELGGLTELREFSINHCGGLTGSIPRELGGLIDLREFLINHCRSLIGPIPQELGQLTVLTNLSIENCEGLTGLIPPELGGLTELVNLSIEWCRGLTGPLPSELGDLTRLTKFSIKGCGGLTGPIPPELGGLTVLTKLSIEGCGGLTGPIPGELGGLTELKELCIRGCKNLTGLIPLELRNTRLTKLYIEGCGGLTVPSEFVGPLLVAELIQPETAERVKVLRFLKELGGMGREYMGPVYLRVSEDR